MQRFDGALPEIQPEKTIEKATRRQSKKRSKLAKGVAMINNNSLGVLKGIPLIIQLSNKKGRTDVWP